MVAISVREPRVTADRAAFRETWTAIRAALGERSVWLVAGFILFFTFSPSFGPPLLYYQTDVLEVQPAVHRPAARPRRAGRGGRGALLYAPLSRRVALRPLINLVHRGHGARHPGVPALPRPPLRRDHRHGLRRGLHGHAARVPGPRRQGVPTPGGGHVLRAAHVRVQRRHAGLAGGRRISLRLDGLRPADHHLRGDHRPRAGSSCRWSASRASRRGRAPPTAAASSRAPTAA